MSSEGEFLCVDSGHVGLPEGFHADNSITGGDDQAGGGYAEKPPGLQMQQHIKEELAKESNAGIAAVKVELTNDPVAQATTVGVAQPAVEPVANAASEPVAKAADDDAQKAAAEVAEASQKAVADVLAKASAAVSTEPDAEASAAALVAERARVDEEVAKTAEIAAKQAEKQAEIDAAVAAKQAEKQAEIDAAAQKLVAKEKELEQVKQEAQKLAAKEKELEQMKQELARTKKELENRVDLNSSSDEERPGAAHDAADQSDGRPEEHGDGRYEYDDHHHNTGCEYCRVAWTVEGCDRMDRHWFRQVASRSMGESSEWVVWAGSHSEGKPDWWTTKDKNEVRRRVKNVDNDRLFRSLAQAIDYRDLFFKCDKPNFKKVEHGTEPLVKHLHSIAFDPLHPDDKNRFLILDWKRGQGSFTLACAHCMWCHKIELPGVGDYIDSFHESSDTQLSNKKKRQWQGWKAMSFLTRENRGLGEQPQHRREQSDDGTRKNHKRSKAWTYDNDAKTSGGYGGGKKHEYDAKGQDRGKGYGAGYGAQDSGGGGHSKHRHGSAGYDAHGQGAQSKGDDIDCGDDSRGSTWHGSSWHGHGSRGYGGGRGAPKGKGADKKQEYDAKGQDRGKGYGAGYGAQDSGGDGHSQRRHGSAGYDAHGQGAQSKGHGKRRHGAGHGSAGCDDSDRGDDGRHGSKEYGSTWHGSGGYGGGGYGRWGQQIDQADFDRWEHSQKIVDDRGPPNQRRRVDLYPAPLERRRERSGSDRSCSDRGMPYGQSDRGYRRQAPGRYARERSHDGGFDDDRSQGVMIANDDDVTKYLIHNKPHLLKDWVQQIGKRH